MKKISKIMALLLVVTFIVTIFAGCSPSTKESNTTSTTEESVTTQESINKTAFKIGCMPLNEPAVQALADLLKPMGYNVEVVVFDGNNLPAIALKDGSIDSLILNHLPWINTFNEANASELVMVQPYIYASYFGLYSSKHKSLEEIPDNASIVVSNDPSNMQRSLLFLQKLGFIKLGDKKGEFFTALDIEENAKNIKLVEVETTATASSFQDADAAIAFTSVMRNAKIDPFSYLAEDGEFVNYPTGLVVNKGNENSQWVKDVITVTQSEDFKTKFNEIFQGAYVLFSDAK